MSQRFTRWFAPIVLMLCLGLAGTAAAQSTIEGTTLGNTVTNPSINYRTCGKNNDIWTARYVGQKKWKHTHLLTQQTRESNIIRYVDGDGVCRQANFDGDEPNLPGMFFRVYSGDCTDPDRCVYVTTQTLVFRHLADDGSTSFQLDWSNFNTGGKDTVRNILVANRFNSHPEAFFADDLVYTACDGSVWKMTFPHLSGTPDPTKLRVSHTRLPSHLYRAESSHYDYYVRYVNHVGTCQVATVAELVAGQPMYFLADNQQKKSWVHQPLQLLTGGLFQGFAVTNPK
jgi:hypothetical protein